MFYVSFAGLGNGLGLERSGLGLSLGTAGLGLEGAGLGLGLVTARLDYNTAHNHASTRHFLYQPSSTLLVGRQERHPACKKTERCGAGMVVCLERDADLHMVQQMPLPLTVSSFSKIQTGFTFLVPAHTGRPGERAVKRSFVRSSSVDISPGLRLTSLAG